MGAVSASLAAVLTSLVAAAVAGRAAAAEVARYDRHQVWRLTPGTGAHVHLLTALSDRPDGLEFLSKPGAVDRTLEVLVPLHKQPAFQDLLDTSGLAYSVIVPDLQRLVEDGRSSGKNGTDYDWETYQDLPELNAWLDAMVAKFPDVASHLVLGNSYEGRPLRVVRICHGPGKPVVFVEAGIHGAEWAGVSTATFLIHQLLTNDSEPVRQVAQAFDWHILPTANPDGYNYAHTADRMWRKTRRPGPNGCYGTDPNRNWDFHWDGPGSSEDPCATQFRGLSPFSEPETRALSQFLAGLRERLLVYVALHTYMQSLMWPYAFGQERADNHQELMEVAKVSVEALSRRYGTIYQTETLFDVFGAVAGSSVDWVKGRLGVRFAFAYELRDTGYFGLLLPEDQLRATAEEAADSIVTMMREVQARTALKR